MQAGGLEERGDHALVAESGRGNSRAEPLAKRPHGGGHGPGKKLDIVGENFGKTSGRPPIFSTSPLCEIPAKFHENLQFFVFLFSYSLFLFFRAHVVAILFWQNLVSPK